jgi:hypothetical protein
VMTPGARTATSALPALDLPENSFPRAPFAGGSIRRLFFFSGGEFRDAVDPI